MLTRTVTAIFGIALFLGCCFAGQVPFLIATIVVAAIATSELIAAEGSGPLPASDRLPSPFNAALAWWALILPAAAFWAAASSPAAAKTFAICAMCTVAFCLVRLRIAAQGRPALGAARSRYGLFGLFYIGAGLGAFALLRGTPGKLAVGPFPIADRGAWVMLFVAVCVWATDTFAYLVGRAVGKRKLAPRLSPGKTVEGSLGGLVGAVVAGLVFAHALQIVPIHGAMIGLIAGTLGQAGDLFESALKRELGIKDFGRLLPGHGGALDRFDSLLFAAPIAWIYLVCFVGI